MLVAVQLPDDLVITDAGIKIRDRRPESPRRAAIVDGIEVPVDPLARAHRHVVVAEQPPPAIQQGVSERASLRCSIRELLADRLRDVLASTRIERKPSGSLTEMPSQRFPGRAPVPRTECRIRRDDGGEGAREARPQPFSIPMPWNGRRLDVFGYGSSALSGARPYLSPTHSRNASKNARHDSTLIVNRRGCLSRSNVIVVTPL